MCVSHTLSLPFSVAENFIQQFIMLTQQDTTRCPTTMVKVILLILVYISKRKDWVSYERKWLADSKNSNHFDFCIYSLKAKNAQKLHWCQKKRQPKFWLNQKSPFCREFIKEGFCAKWIFHTEYICRKVWPSTCLESYTPPPSFPWHHSDS